MLFRSAASVYSPVIRENWKLRDQVNTLLAKLEKNEAARVRGQLLEAKKVMQYQAGQAQNLAVENQQLKEYLRKLQAISQEQAQIQASMDLQMKQLYEYNVKSLQESHQTALSTVEQNVRENEVPKQNDIDMLKAQLTEARAECAKIKEGHHHGTRKSEEANSEAAETAREMENLQRMVEQWRIEALASQSDARKQIAELTSAWRLEKQRGEVHVASLTSSMNAQIASLTSSIQAERQRAEAQASAQVAAVTSSMNAEIAALSSSLQAERQRGEALVVALTMSLDAERQRGATRAADQNEAMRSRMYAELESVFQAQAAIHFKALQGHLRQ